MNKFVAAERHEPAVLPDDGAATAGGAVTDAIAWPCADARTSEDARGQQFRRRRGARQALARHPHLLVAVHNDLQWGRNASKLSQCLL